MSRIVTFLGQAGTGHTPIAIATAKWFAERGKRVLLVTDTPNPSAELVLNLPLAAQPQVVAPKLEVVQLQTTVLLEQSWSDVKSLISTYLPLPIFSEEIYPGEVLILPGLDAALAFNALRQFYTSGDYDVIVYRGRGDLETLRLLGVPNILEWYFRRFRRVFEAMDVAKIADSIGGPLAAAMVSANLDTKQIEREANRVRSWIEEGVSVINDPTQFTAYLVTIDEESAIAETRWLWGSAQQVNIRISGVLVYPGSSNELELQQAFEPLSVHPIPALKKNNWTPLLKALPDFDCIPTVPEPVEINCAQKQVRVFLPGFNRKQVKLTQMGSDLTVEAGDQRRNIRLPLELRDRPIQSGKFDAPYLVIDF